MSSCSRSKAQYAMTVGTRIKKRLLQEKYCCSAKRLWITTASSSCFCEFGLTAGCELDDIAYTLGKRVPLNFRDKISSANHIKCHINGLALHGPSSFRGRKLLGAISVVIILSIAVAVTITWLASIEFVERCT